MNCLLCRSVVMGMGRWSPWHEPSWWWRERHDDDLWHLYVVELSLWEYFITSIHHDDISYEHIMSSVTSVSCVWDHFTIDSINLADSRCQRLISSINLISASLIVEKKKVLLLHLQRNQISTKVRDYIRS